LSKDHGALFVTGVDELKEEIAAVRNDREIADLIDDEQSEAAEEPDFLAQNSFAFGLGESADDIGEAAEVDAGPRNRKAAGRYSRSLPRPLSTYRKPY
jgi:hypothetical protein